MKESCTYARPRTSRLGPRPASAPQASHRRQMVGSPRLPQASARLGQSAHGAVLAAHGGRAFHKVAHAQRQRRRAAEGRRVARAAAQDRHLDVGAAAAVPAHLGGRLDARRGGRRPRRRRDTACDPPLWLRHRRRCGLRQMLRDPVSEAHRGLGAASAVCVGPWRTRTRRRRTARRKRRRWWRWRQSCDTLLATQSLHEPWCQLSLGARNA